MVKALKLHCLFPCQGMKSKSRRKFRCSCNFFLMATPKDKFFCRRLDISFLVCAKKKYSFKIKPILKNASDLLYLTDCGLVTHSVPFFSCNKVELSTVGKSSMKGKLAVLPPYHDSWSQYQFAIFWCNFQLFRVWWPHNKSQRTFARGTLFCVFTWKALWAHVRLIMSLCMLDHQIDLNQLEERFLRAHHFLFHLELTTQLVKSASDLILAVLTGSIPVFAFLFSGLPSPSFLLGRP